MTNQLDNTHELTAALVALNNAVNGIAGPRTHTVRTDSGTRVVTRPAVYTEMTESTEAAQGTSLGGHSRSLPPVWIDGCDWLQKVDTTVYEWWPDTGGTIQRLDKLTRAAWRPQDVDFVTYMANTITAWTREADTLLDGGRKQFSLNAPCPACGETWVTRRDDLGEHVRAPALNVSEMGCNCAACGHHWGLEYALHLARVIDCAPIEGVITE